MVKWEYRHGPVVDLEMFERVQAILRKNTKHNHRIYEDQRTYLLSGILFDKDGNKYCGQSVKKKRNPYYISTAKNIRVRAERIEKAVLNFIGSLISKNGMLEEAAKRTFNSKNSGLKDLEERIAHNAKEIRQCEELAAIIATKSRNKIIENPERMEEILLEGIEVRKQTMARMDELRIELIELQKQKDRLCKFKDSDGVKANLKKAIKLFESSSSKRKKNLIQMLVPKLVLDERQDQLLLFINPFLENPNEFLQETIAEVEQFLPQNLIQTNWDENSQVREPYCEILSQRGKKVCIVEDWRGGRDSNPRPPA